MLVTLTLEADAASGFDARDLGHLLRKHPARVQSFDASVGTIHVFYPHVSPERTTVAMLLEVDPVGLVRNKRFRGDAGSLDTYVNDRPYVASSLLSVALGSVFRSAMTGESEAHPELAGRSLHLRIEVPVVATRGGGTADLAFHATQAGAAVRTGAAGLSGGAQSGMVNFEEAAKQPSLARRLFEPLGWVVDERPIPLDDTRPEWGDSRYSALILGGQVRLAHALRQLYVLLPVLDDSKHYWVGDDEATKLVRQGEGWLPGHPERELIASRYLAHQNSLVALAQFDAAEPGHASTSTTPADEAQTPLRVQRAEAVLGVLAELGAHRVIDMGSGSGALLRRLQADRSYTDIVGVDVDARLLERAATRLGLAQASDAERARITLLHGSVVYRDDRLRGYDAMVLMEVVEHVNESWLPALEDAVFAFAAPRAVIVTTPNRDYNALYPGLAAGAMRHDDHRFEWSRAEFRDWAEGVTARYGYTVELRPVGPVDEGLGSPTQMAVFRKVRA